MTDEELKVFKEVCAKRSIGKWRFINGRPGGLKEGQGNRIDPRWDIYIGPEILSEELSTTEKRNPSQAIVTNGRKAIVHFHPESPMMFERHENHLHNAEFIIAANHYIDEIILELETLKAESQKAKCV